MRAALVLLFVILFTVQPGARLQSDSGRVVVSAAISLTDALQEIARAYGATGGEVTFNFAASNVLARQIVNGAPVDIFISADEAQMDYAQKEGAIDSATRKVVVSNRLAIVTRPDVPMTSPQSLLDAKVRRIAVGDPAAVPAGVYAKAYLERAGIWNQLHPKILPLANVRAALAAVESGGADAAIVYESDAAVSRSVQVPFVFAASDGPPILYPAAIVKQSRNRQAAGKFLAFLQGKEAGVIFKRLRFSAPPGTPGPADLPTHGPR